MAAKRHKYLSNNHLRDTKTSTCLQQNIKKCLLFLHEKLVIVTYPSQNTLQNKKSEILSKCRHENKNLLSHFDPSNTTSIYIKKTPKNLKRRKYHFPPSTITPATQYMYHLSPLTPILLFTRLYYQLILLFYEN